MLFTQGPVAATASRFIIMSARPNPHVLLSIYLGWRVSSITIHSLTHQLPATHSPSAKKRLKGNREKISRIHKFTAKKRKKSKSQICTISKIEFSLSEITTHFIDPMGRLICLDKRTKILATHIAELRLRPRRASSSTPKPLGNSSG
jgi:hypothetical protein